MDLEKRKEFQLKYGRLGYRIAGGLAAAVFGCGLVAVATSQFSAWLTTIAPFVLAAGVIFAIGFGWRAVLAGETSIGRTKKK